MRDDPKRASRPSAARDGGKPARGTRPIARDHRVVRTVDLTDEDIAIEASEMAPGFEHLNIEVDEKPEAAGSGGEHRPKEGGALR